MTEDIEGPSLLVVSREDALDEDVLEWNDKKMSVPSFNKPEEIWDVSGKERPDMFSKDESPDMRKLLTSRSCESLEDMDREDDPVLLSNLRTETSLMSGGGKCTEDWLLRDAFVSRGCDMMKRGAF